MVHCVAVLLVLAGCGEASGQQSSAQPAAALSFEVASIKRNMSGNGGYVRIEPGARFNAVGATVMLILRQAYGVQSFSVVNLPAWATNEGYDIIAKAPDGIEAAPNMAALLRGLLKDRFGLVAHAETREMPTYDLVLARPDRKLGDGIQPATVDCAARTAGTPPPQSPSGEALCGITGGPSRLQVRGYAMSRVAGILAGTVQRAVIDKTELAGPWNLDVRFAPDQPAVVDGAVVPPSDAPSLFTAIQEQLGLRLARSRGPVEVLVIDRLSRPTSD